MRTQSVRTPFLGSVFCCSAHFAKTYVRTSYVRLHTLSNRIYLSCSNSIPAQSRTGSVRMTHMHNGVDDDEDDDDALGVMFIRVRPLG